MTSNTVTRIRSYLIVAATYAGLYIALDWISFIHVLPEVGFTLWNPPPALSLALLLTRGFRFAPILPVVSMLSDALVDGFPAGVLATCVADTIGAAGYTTIAIVLRQVSGADRGFQNTADVVWFLIVAVVGVLAIAGLTSTAFVLMHALPASRFAAAVSHFWIGDLAGVVGLLPALIGARVVRANWNDLTRSQLLTDITVFATGLLLALYIIFKVADYRELGFFYLLLLPVIWVAVRRGLFWSTVAVFVSQAALIAAIVAFRYPSNDFQAFQLLSLTVSATGLLVGAVVTERQRAAVSLRQQQAELDRMARLTTAGALGMAIVHQISQPLATIATYTHACRHLLRVKPENLDILGETMEKAEAEVLRVGEIVDRLRDFLSNGNRRLSPVNPGAVARDIVAALADDARRRGVEVQIDGISRAVLMADRVQIEQVLINLIRNAIDAASGQPRAKGHVRVVLRDLKDEVEVAIEDDGPGVAPDLVPRLFEPFETNKPGGMGLGLWLSHELVHGHGGRLRYDPGVTPGARFVFRLPRDQVNDGF